MAVNLSCERKRMDREGVSPVFSNLEIKFADDQSWKVTKTVLRCRCRCCHVFSRKYPKRNRHSHRLTNSPSFSRVDVLVQGGDLQMNHSTRDDDDDDGTDDKAAVGPIRRTAYSATLVPTDNNNTSSPNSHCQSPLSFPSSPMTGLRVETFFGEDDDDIEDDDNVKNPNVDADDSNHEAPSEVNESSAIIATTHENAKMSRPMYAASTPAAAASAPAAAAAASSPRESEEQQTPSRNTQQQQQFSNVNIHKILMSNGLQSNQRVGSPYSPGANSFLHQQQQHQLSSPPPLPFSAAGAATPGANSNNNSMIYTPSPAVGAAAAAGKMDTDEQSNRYFMSEPSVSDQEESQRVRARHRLLATGGTFRHLQYSDDEEEDDDEHEVHVPVIGGAADTTPLQQRQQRPPHSSNRRATFFQTSASSPIPPSSPGNTSISSWDISPARQHPRVFFQFTTNSSNVSSSEHSREGEQQPQQQQQQQQQQPGAAAVVVERDPSNGQRQIRINHNHLQPPLLLQQNYQDSINSHPQQQQRLCPDGTLIFDCIESPSQPQQRKTSAVSSASATSSLSSPQQQQRLLQTAPSMPTIPMSSSPQQAQQASSNFAQRLRQSLQYVGDDDENDSIIYKHDDDEGLVLQQTRTGNNGNDVDMDAKLPASDDSQTFAAAAAESSLIMAFSDSEEEEDDKNDSNSNSQAAAAAAVSVMASTLEESNDTTTSTTEQANNVVSQQQAAAADYSETQKHSTKEKMVSSSLPSSSVDYQQFFRGGRRHSQPTSDSFSATAAEAAAAPPPVTTLLTTTAPTKRPPRAVYARSSNSNNSNVNKSASSLSSAAAVNAAAAAAAAITSSNKARRHRRVKSIDGEGTHHHGGEGTESSPAFALAAANNIGNSSGGSGGGYNNNNVFRHRRSRSGDAAAASLVTGCSDWKGMESLDKGSFGIGTASSSDFSGGRRKSNKYVASSGNVRHRRSRSGDAAAASLMTGGNNWKGMEMDNIPIPSISSSGSHDDDDESQSEVLRAIISNNTQQKQQQQIKKNPSGGSSDVSSKGSERGRIGTPPTPTTQRPPKPEFNRTTARATATPKQPQPVTAMQGESSGLLPGAGSDYSRANTGGGGYGSMPLTLDELHQQRQYQQQQQQHFAGSWPPGGSAPEIFPSLQGSRRMSWNPSHPPPPPPPPPHLPQGPFLAQIRNSNLGDAWTYSSADDCGIGFVPEREDYEYEEASDVCESDSDRPFSVQNNRLGHGMQGDHSILLQQIEEQYENRKLRGPYQAVLRPSNRMDDSPFANIGKTSAEKARRSVFFPKTMLTEEEANALPTYICPRCKTLQRAFFSVSDAPKQMEGPGGYLALYFAIYVVSSLFIFGLEEGWEPLDCVYFAVITLTSTGLGDFVPTTDPNKIICSIFIYFGVACIGLLLGTYIAGTLDDRAVHDAKEKQIQSCPNCARLQTIKESSARRPRQATVVAADDMAAPLGKPLIRGKSPRHMSERIGLERGHFDQQEQHTAVYIPRHHHHQQINSQDTQEQNPSSHQHRQASLPFLPGEKGENLQCKPAEVADSPATTGSKQQRSMDPVPPPPPPFSSYQLLTPTQQVKQAAILGSPMTRQILARQKHSRHGSIDISNKSVVGQRKYSADIPSFLTPPPTMRSINEGIPLEQAETAPSLPFVGQNVNYSRGTSNNYNTSSSEDADDASSCSSSSSDLSTVDELIDDRVSNMKAAKYVFLTLRQALVNSLVIIAVGCIGFWLIERFSLVDSWYFTTVLLTTVGYGDIVPVTRGGKLFATVYLLVGGTVLLNNMSLISMIPLELRKRRIERAVLTQFGDHLDDAALRELATGPVIQRLSLSAQRADGLDECTREMFALAMLVRLGKVTEQDIKETFASFRRLDVNNEGVLNSKSIIAGMIAKRRSQNAARDAEGHPPPPPLSSMNSQTFQNTQQQDPVMSGYYGMTGNGPPLTDALPPYHYDGDPEAGMGRESYDWTLGGAYWLQGAGGDSSSFNSSNISSEDDSEDNPPEAAVAVRPTE